MSFVFNVHNRCIYDFGLCSFCLLCIIFCLMHVKHEKCWKQCPWNVQERLVQCIQWINGALWGMKFFFQNWSDTMERNLPFGLYMSNISSILYIGCCLLGYECYIFHFIFSRIAVDIILHRNTFNAQQRQWKRCKFNSLRTTIVYSAQRKFHVAKCISIFLNFAHPLHFHNLLIRLTFWYQIWSFFRKSCVCQNAAFGKHTILQKLCCSENLLFKY